MSRCRTSWTLWPSFGADSPLCRANVGRTLHQLPGREGEQGQRSARRGGCLLYASELPGQVERRQEGVTMARDDHRNLAPWGRRDQGRNGSSGARRAAS